MFRLIILNIIFVVLSLQASAGVVKFPAKDVYGKGPLPYNYRIIDGNIHAGGHPLGPIGYFRNTDEQVLNILSYLRSRGVKTIIDLENSWWIQRRYRKFLKKAGIKRIHIPMHIRKMPNEGEWEQIKVAMEDPVYIHCKWGADRTGAVIGRYLVEENGYDPKEAWKAVITGGSHAGPLGGLKTSVFYRKLTIFFWPDSRYEDLNALKKAR
jgi:protein tyrosine/serine phosphatase